MNAPSPEKRANALPAGLAGLSAVGLLVDVTRVSLARSSGETVVVVGAVRNLLK